MKCKILHDAPGRLRVQLLCRRMSLADADTLEYSLRAVAGVTHVTVHDRTRCAIVAYLPGTREVLLRAFASFSFTEAARALVPEHTSRALNREFEDALASAVARRMLVKLFFPAPLSAALAVMRAVPYVRAGLSALLHGRLTVAVLDAAAVSVSLLRRDFPTAGSVMFMLRLGEILEEWTHKKSVADLAGAMSLNVERVWIKKGGAETLAAVREVAPGELAVVRTGGMIPLDGKVEEGEATVNQSSLTGESLPVLKRAGDPVYAGTVVEEGEIVFRVSHALGHGRFDRVVAMIEESERLKSASEARASHLADRLVPYTFLGTGLVWLATRNPMKALAVLMVDFSCALKLSMPVAVLSAMRECSGHGVSVKGGRFLEAVAAADTVVFDKTGTLTCAAPRVERVIPFGGRDEAEMLRLAACLEEHYPHSMANAVVEEARRRGLSHEEYHSRVEYVVAHGISSTVEGKKVVIGSQHFVFEDEGCAVPPGEEAKFAALPEEFSQLFLAVSGELAAVICVSDPLRADAAAAVRALHGCGIGRIVMMTGDNRRTAAAVARAVGVDGYRAEVLPEDKAAFVRAEKAAGHTVIMIGDGVNDSPALSEASAGIAINTGAAIAREIADITVSEDDLFALVTLRRLSEALMARIRQNYRFIVGFNLALIVLGVAGVLPPAYSALLHNASTLGVSLKSMTDLLPGDGEE